MATSFTRTALGYDPTRPDYFFSGATFDDIGRDEELTRALHKKLDPDGSRFRGDDDALREGLLNDITARKSSILASAWEWGASQFETDSEKQWGNLLGRLYETAPNRLLEGDAGERWQALKSGLIGGVAYDLPLNLLFSPAILLKTGFGMFAGAKALAPGLLATGKSGAELVGAATRAGAWRGAKQEAVINGFLGFTGDVLDQAVDVRRGLQDEVSLGQALFGAGAGAAIGGAFGAGGGALTGRRLGREMAMDVPIQERQILSRDPTPEEEMNTSVLGRDVLRPQEEQRAALEAQANAQAAATQSVEPEVFPDLNMRLTQDDIERFNATREAALEPDNGIVHALMQRARQIEIGGAPGENPAFTAPVVRAAATALTQIVENMPERLRGLNEQVRAAVEKGDLEARARAVRTAQDLVAMNRRIADGSLSFDNDSVIPDELIDTIALLDDRTAALLGDTRRALEAQEALRAGETPGETPPAGGGQPPAPPAAPAATGGGQPNPPAPAGSGGATAGEAPTPAAPDAAAPGSGAPASAGDAGGPAPSQAAEAPAPTPAPAQAATASPDELASYLSGDDLADLEALADALEKIGLDFESMSRRLASKEAGGDGMSRNQLAEQISSAVGRPKEQVIEEMTKGQKAVRKARKARAAALADQAATPKETATESQAAAPAPAPSPAPAQTAGETATAAGDDAVTPEVDEALKSELAKNAASIEAMQGRLDLLAGMDALATTIDSGVTRVTDALASARQAVGNDPDALRKALTALVDEDETLAPYVHGLRKKDLADQEKAAARIQAIGQRAFENTIVSAITEIMEDPLDGGMFRKYVEILGLPPARAKSIERVYERAVQDYVAQAVGQHGDNIVAILENSPDLVNHLRGAGSGRKKPSFNIQSIAEDADIDLEAADGKYKTALRKYLKSLRAELSATGKLDEFSIREIMVGAARSFEQRWTGDPLAKGRFARLRELSSIESSGKLNREQQRELARLRESMGIYFDVDSRDADVGSLFENPIVDRTGSVPTLVAGRQQNKDVSGRTILGRSQGVIHPAEIVVYKDGELGSYSYSGWLNVNPNNMMGAFRAARMDIIQAGMEARDKKFRRRLRLGGKVFVSRAGVEEQDIITATRMNLLAELQMKREAGEITEAQFRDRLQSIGDKTWQVRDTDIAAVMAILARRKEIETAEAVMRQRMAKVADSDLSLEAKRKAMQEIASRLNKVKFDAQRQHDIALGELISSMSGENTKQAKRAARRAAKEAKAAEARAKAAEAPAPAKAAGAQEASPTDGLDIVANSNAKVAIVEVAGQKYEFDPAKHISFDGDKTGTVSLFGERIGTFTKEDNGRITVKLNGASRTVAVANASGLLNKKTFLNTQRALIEKNRAKLTKIDGDEGRIVNDGDTLPREVSSTAADDAAIDAIAGGPSAGAVTKDMLNTPLASMALPEGRVWAVRTPDGGFLEVSSKRHQTLGDLLKNVPEEELSKYTLGTLPAREMRGPNRSRSPFNPSGAKFRMARFVPYGIDPGSPEASLMSHLAARAEAEKSGINRHVLKALRGDATLDDTAMIDLPDGRTLKDVLLDFDIATFGARATNEMFQSSEAFEEGIERLAAEAELIEKYLPLGVRRSQTSRRTAFHHVRKSILTHGGEEAEALLDMLRRLDPSLQAREMPQIRFSENSRDSGAVSSEGMLYVGKENPRVTTRMVFAHELSHWAYVNILSPSERVEFLRLLRPYVKESGGIDYNAMRKAIPGLEELEKHVGQKIPNFEGDVNEIFAWMGAAHILRQQEADAAPLWKRLVTYLRNVVAAILGRDIDPEFMPLFERIMPSEPGRPRYHGDALIHPITGQPVRAIHGVIDDAHRTAMGFLDSLNKLDEQRQEIDRAVWSSHADAADMIDAGLKAAHTLFGWLYGKRIQNPNVRMTAEKVRQVIIHGGNWSKYDAAKAKQLFDPSSPVGSVLNVAESLREFQAGRGIEMDPTVAFQGEEGGNFLVRVDTSLSGNPEAMADFNMRWERLAKERLENKPDGVSDEDVIAQAADEALEAVIRDYDLDVGGTPPTFGVTSVSDPEMIHRARVFATDIRDILRDVQDKLAMEMERATGGYKPIPYGRHPDPALRLSPEEIAARTPMAKRKPKAPEAASPMKKAANAAGGRGVKSVSEAADAVADAASKAPDLSQYDEILATLPARTASSLRERLATAAAMGSVDGIPANASPMRQLLLSRMTHRDGDKMVVLRSLTNGILEAVNDRDHIILMENGDLVDQVIRAFKGEDLSAKKPSDPIQASSFQWAVAEDDGANRQLVEFRDIMRSISNRVTSGDPGQIEAAVTDIRRILLNLGADEDLAPMIVKESFPGIGSSIRSSGGPAIAGRADPMLVLRKVKAVIDGASESELVEMGLRAGLLPIEVSRETVLNSIAFRDPTGRISLHPRSLADDFYEEVSPNPEAIAKYEAILEIDEEIADPRLSDADVMKLIKQRDELLDDLAEIQGHRPSTYDGTEPVLVDMGSALKERINRYRVLDLISALAVDIRDPQERGLFVDAASSLIPPEGATIPSAEIISLARTHVGEYRTDAGMNEALRRSGYSGIVREGGIFEPFSEPSNLFEVVGHKRLPDDQLTGESPFPTMFLSLVADPNRSPDAVAVQHAAMRGGMTFPQSSAVSKMVPGKGRPLTEQDLDAIRELGPKKGHLPGIQIRSNASRALRVGAAWLANKMAPAEGTGIHDAIDSTQARWIGRLREEIYNLTGATSGLRRWARDLYRNGSVWKVEMPQTDLERDVVIAMREGRAAVAKLPPEGRKLARMVADFFATALQDQRDAGINIGNLTGNGFDYYLPQRLNQTALMQNREEAIDAFARWFAKDSGDPISETRARAEKMVDFAIDDFEHGAFVESNVYANLFGDRIRERGLRISSQDMADFGLAKFFDNNLVSLIDNYAHSASARLEMARAFGVGGQALETYHAVAREGRQAMVQALTRQRTAIVGETAAQNGDVVRFQDVLYEALFDTPQEANAAIDQLAKIIGNAQSISVGVASATRTLVDLYRASGKRGVEQFEKMAEGLVNGMVDFGPHGLALNQREINFQRDWVAAVAGKPMHGDRLSGNKSLRRASSILSTFNALTLLSMATVASLPDMGLPLIRSGSMKAYMTGLAKNISAAINGDPEYRNALAAVSTSIGASIQESLIGMHSGRTGRLGNAFFQATGLTPWTRLQRNIAASVGFESIKANQALVKRLRSEGATNTVKYRRAMRALRQLGLGHLADGQPLRDLQDHANDEAIRRALHRFADQTVFMPNKTDIPLWAQDPLGRLVFQFKSYPLMFGRMVRRTFSEALAFETGGRDMTWQEIAKAWRTGQLDKLEYAGDVKPLLYLLTVGPALGYGAAAARDVIVGRNEEADDVPSLAWHSVRDRSLTQILESLGVEGVGPDDPAIDALIGGYIEGLMSLGALGLVADMIHQTAIQLDHGAYGQTRTLGLIFGPTVGTILDAQAALAGAADAARDAVFDAESSNAPERTAVRGLFRRLPLVGSFRSLSESVVDSVAGEAER